MSARLMVKLSANLLTTVLNWTISAAIANHFFGSEYCPNYFAN
jgi:hypothetical protein